MSTIAEFRVPARNTVLGTTFDRLETLTVELESAVSKTDPFLWVSGVDIGRVNRAFDVDPTVRSATCVATTDTESIYDVAFDAHCSITEDIVSDGGSLLSARGSAGWWLLEIRFTDRTALGEAHERLNELDVPVDIVRVTNVERATGRSRLTPEQHEAITEAFERGYFEIPRRISMEELAAELGISHQALSERFRRAYERLVDAELEAIG